MKKKTKKKPQDATMRNVRAARKRNKTLKLQVVELAKNLDTLIYDVAHLIRKTNDLESEVIRLQRKRGRG